MKKYFIYQKSIIILHSQLNPKFHDLFHQRLQCDNIHNSIHLTLKSTFHCQPIKDVIDLLLLLHLKLIINSLHQTVLKIRYIDVYNQFYLLLEHHLLVPILSLLVLTSRHKNHSQYLQLKALLQKLILFNDHLNKVYQQGSNQRYNHHSHIALRITLISCFLFHKSCNPMF